MQESITLLTPIIVWYLYFLVQIKVKDIIFQNFIFQNFIVEVSWEVERSCSTGFIPKFEV